MLQLYLQGGVIMNEIKKMFCPSCGGPVSFQPGREDTFCSHCGAQLYFKDDMLEVKLKHEERKMEHEEKVLEYKDRAEQRQVEIDSQKNQFKNTIKMTIILLAASGAILIGFTLFMKFATIMFN